MRRVMVIEGRLRPRAAVLLASEGMEVAQTLHGIDEAIHGLSAFEPHAILLEVGVLTADVVRMCEVLEPMTRAPIILCCEVGDESGIVAGLRAGAQVVVTEPVGSHELVARVRAVLRRCSEDTAPETDEDVLIVGPIVLDTSRGAITVNGHTIAVPRREFAIAELLMRHAGVVVTRETLMRELWGSTRFTASLGVQVGRLRARLAAIEGRSRIVSVRGVGYRLVTNEELDAVSSLATSESIDVAPEVETAALTQNVVLHAP